MILVVVFGAILLAISGLWLLTGIALAIVPLLLMGGLALFRRAEDHGDVAEAEERFADDWRWLREAGPFKRAAAVAILILVLVSVIVIRYLQWRRELPS
jgi:hypothetical protein